MTDKRKMLMFVYNDLSTDSRVQRSIQTLAVKFHITVVSIGKPYVVEGVENVIISSKYRGMRKYFDTVIKFIKFSKKLEYDYLYLHDYYSCIPGLFLIKNKSSIYDAHELIIGSKEFPATKREEFFGFFEKKLLKKVQLVICADETRGTEMVKYYGLERTPYVVPNYSELEIDDSYKLDPAVSEFFLDKRKTIVYAGALAPGRNIDTVIHATIQKKQDYKLMIIGDGPDREHLEEVAKDARGLTYLFTGSIPYKNLGNLLKYCDVGYLSYPTTNLNNIYCAPNKIYEYASVELPMICNDNPNLISIVGKNGIGVCVSEKNEQGCVASMEEALAVIDSDYASFKKNIRSFRHNNSWLSISNDYLRIVETI